MNDLLNRVKSNPNICGIDFTFTGQLVPSTIEGYQPFNNSIPQGTDFKPAHFGKAAVSFDEESETSNAGISYKQKLAIRFPATDAQRAVRLELMHKVKFIRLHFSNGKDLVIGRQDFEQNARLRTKIKVDERLAQAEFETVSIFASGYMPPVDAFGLPTLFPISFVNTDN